MNFYELRPNIRVWESANPRECGEAYFEIGYIEIPSLETAVAILPKVACTSVVYSIILAHHPKLAFDLYSILKSVKPAEAFHVVHRFATERGLFTKKPNPDFQKVSLIRDPAARILSAFRNQVIGHDVTVSVPHHFDFSAFLAWLSYQSPFSVDQHFRPFSLCLPFDTDIYPLENASEAFCERIGIEHPLQVLNSSLNNTAPTATMNRHHRDFITRLYRFDCHSYNDLFQFFENKE